MGTLQIILLAFAAYIGLYAIVDRICKTIDNRSITNAYIAALKPDEEKTTDDNDSSDADKKEKQWSNIFGYGQKKVGFVRINHALFMQKIDILPTFMAICPFLKREVGTEKQRFFGGLRAFCPLSHFYF